MNNHRRKAITDLMHTIDCVQRTVDDLKAQESSYQNAVPEALQAGRMYEASAEAVDSLESAVDLLSQAYDSLQEALG
jgi:phage shock protein A